MLGVLLAPATAQAHWVYDAGWVWDSGGQNPDACLHQKVSIAGLVNSSSIMKTSAHNGPCEAYLSWTREVPVNNMTEWTELFRSGGSTSYCDALTAVYNPFSASELEQHWNWGRTRVVAHCGALPRYFGAWGLTAIQYPTNSGVWQPRDQNGNLTGWVWSGWHWIDGKTKTVQPPPPPRPPHGTFRIVGGRLVRVLDTARSLK
jgi:hypothetical protein